MSQPTSSNTRAMLAIVAALLLGGCSILGPKPEPGTS